MKDFVSRRWITVAALLTGVVLACAILGPLGFGWTTVAGFSLLSGLALLSVTALMAMKTTRSIGEVLRDLDGEPARAVAVAPEGRTGAKG
jgi:hypothetical protein